LLSALVAHTAWHWMSERGGQLAAYQFQWPALDILLLAALVRWLMLLLILAGAVWLLFLLFGTGPRPSGSEAAAGAEE
jgi:hypothetical protein